MNLSEEEKRELLELARSTITSKCSDQSHQFNIPNSDSLNEKRGSFVSLYKKQGELAGCIGFIDSPDPLYQTVIQAAEAAAFRDPRFEGIRREDLSDLKIEISALTPLELIHEPTDLEIGVHGIFLKKGDYHGLLLPQVAVRYKWNAETFLDQTCTKAGLQTGSWKEPDAEIYRFSAEVFSEEESQPPENS
jgi:AmmeMemoRadiSam system protein A